MSFWRITNSAANAETIRKNIENAKTTLNAPEGQEYKNACIQGLQMRDSNNDGVTTSKEMSTNFNKLTQSIFKNASFSSKFQASALSVKAGSIFEAYAGDDGVLDEYEYSAAINSDEYNEMITKYNELQDELDNYDYETDDNTNTQQVNPAFQSIDSLKTSYIDEILSERIKVTNYVIDLSNSGVWDSAKGDAYLGEASYTVDGYIHQLADCVFKEAVPVLSSDTLSKDEKEAKLAEIKAKMEEIKNEGKKAMKALYAPDEQKDDTTTDKTP